MKPERPEPEEHWHNRQFDEQHRQEESFISSNLPVIKSVCVHCDDTGWINDNERCICVRYWDRG